MDRTFKLHQLCPTCAAIVAKSRILRTKSLERGTEEDTKVGVRQTETEEYTYMTAAALLLSANEGCHLCSLLYEQAEKGNIIVEDGPVFTLIIEREHYDDHSGPVWLYLRVEEARLWAWLEISEGPYMKSPSDGEIKGALFSGRTSSNGWFDNINNWLRDCRDGHAHCRVTNTGAELPSRLLDVGTSAQGAEQLPVRLCSTCDMAQNPLYLTLSYCWGKARFLRLLGENHDECFRGIPESKLPATFRDAVTVTRRLGFRYLWIDSLCIIQDSEADWVAESAKMGDVYRCAVLTISALWGSDPYAGLFTQCRPLSFEDCVLQIEGKPVRIDAHTRPKIPKGPLLRRGWVFQERVLCPRTLFYSKGTIFWECIQREANDKHDKVLPPLNRKYESQWTSKQYVHYLAKRLEWDEWNDGNSQYGPKQLRMHRSWYELQRDYHMLDFTLETDRLVAIRGLITLVGCGDSVAGLRRDMMLPELLWDSMVIQSDHRIIGEQDIAEEKYIGPSWSWACLKPTRGINHYFSMYATEEHVQDGHTRDRRLVQWAAVILEINVQQRPNGQVTSGHLKMQAPLVKLDHRITSYGSWCPDVPRLNAYETSDKFGLLLARVCETSERLDEAPYTDFFLVLEKIPNVDDTFRRIALMWQDSHNTKLIMLFPSRLSGCQKSIVYLQ